jgi:RNase P/RNase MRP subunit p29
MIEHLTDSELRVLGAMIKSADGWRGSVVGEPTGRLVMEHDRRIAWAKAVLRKVRRMNEQVQVLNQDIKDKGERS